MEKEWWEGVGDGSRLLIAPAPSPTAGAAAAAAAAAGINGCLLSLRHPKSGNATNYLLCNDNEGVSASRTSLVQAIIYVLVSWRLCFSRWQPVHCNSCRSCFHFVAHF
ncbi:hypothetical protein OIU79_011209 [Salix purpurea]|uniref:Uncharacterized protein n=1 Tax=Salix purpurea TaxID=77065 RepID=A0A9Q0Q0B5_SALPP|nr:hypothetical protein OIU79_011209 [Salix purpurea]